VLAVEGITEGDGEAEQARTDDVLEVVERLGSRSVAGALLPAAVGFVPAHPPSGRRLERGASLASRHRRPPLVCEFGPTHVVHRPRC
jgi:hypothetical protein